MTTTPTIEGLAEIMRRVFGNSALTIEASTSAASVPGWDSLSHVVLMIEIDAVYGVFLQPSETAKLPHVGALLKMLQGRMSGT